MKRRRLLAVPSSIDEWNQLQERTSNAYRTEQDCFQDTQQRGRLQRPLPSSQILSSTIIDDFSADGQNAATTSTPLEAPFMKKFFTAVGVEISVAIDGQVEGTKDNCKHLEDIGKFGCLIRNMLV
jgi:hypothetical protein